jgi:hypothetical protein
VEQLLAAAKLLRLPSPSQGDFVALVAQLLERNSHMLSAADSCDVELELLLGPPPVGALIRCNLLPRRACAAVFSSGIDLATSPHRALNSVSTGDGGLPPAARACGMELQLAAATLAALLPERALTPLLLDAHGWLAVVGCVGPQSSLPMPGDLWLVKRGHIVKSGPTQTGLSSRSSHGAALCRTICAMCAKLGIPAATGGQHTLLDLLSADEAFVTSSRYVIAGVRSVDGQPIGTDPSAVHAAAVGRVAAGGLWAGPVTSQIAGALIELVGCDYVRQASATKA